MRRRALLTGLAGAALTAAEPRLLAASAEVRPAALLAERLQDVLLAPSRPVIPAVPGTAPQTPEALRHALFAVRRDFQACQWITLADALPRLVRAAEATAATSHGEDQIATHTVLADVYTVVTAITTKIDEDGLGWIASDRARRAADTSGDPLAIAASIRWLSVMARRAGHRDRALELAVHGAEQLDVAGREPSPAHLSWHGLLLASAGYTAAQAGDRERSGELLDAAAAAAARLGGDRNLLGTAFGPTNVTLFRISSAFALGDAGIAIAHAGTVDASAIRVVERQARYWVDVARAYRQWNKPAKCYEALTIAERIAPDEVRSRPIVRALAIYLLSTPTHTSMRGVRDFAARVGAVT